MIKRHTAQKGQITMWWGVSLLLLGLCLPSLAQASEARFIYKEVRWRAAIAPDPCRQDAFHVRIIRQVRLFIREVDALNRVTQITDGQNGLTGFGYDPNGNLLTVTDAKNQTTTYTYDTMDRLATRTDPVNRQESYTYDLNGNLNTFTDRKNQISSFTYDVLNRRTASQYADSSTTAMSYDPAGRLATAEDSTSGRIEFSYDTLDRLVQELTPQGTVAYAYDVLGRRTSMTANGQSPTSYGYDDASRLTAVTQGTQSVGLGYDNAGRRTSLTYPNGVITSYGYDDASRLATLTHQGPSALIESLTYSYDAAGNRTSLTRSNGTATDLPSAVQAAYDAANEQIQFNNATPNLTYDANGNLTTQTDTTGTTTYTWDARNRLVAISGPSVSASFVYDALGRRMNKTINGVTTEFQYDGNDIVAEIGGDAVGATYLRSLNIDEPFIRQGSGNEYYHTDALGSVLALSDQAGTVQTMYQYEAFGKTTVTGTSANPFQYTGRENDGTGVYYFRMRYYSVAMQKFISEDPIGFGGGINKYSYVFNSPVNLIDLIGMNAGGKCPCSETPTIPAHPGNVSVDDNMERMRDFPFFTPFSEQLTFMEMFETGGPWDYKSQPGGDFTDFGNFNYGAVCAATGHSLFYCQNGAGFAHIARYVNLTLHTIFDPYSQPKYGGKGFPFISAPYGDQPEDSAMIAQGYAYAGWKNNCQ